MRFAATISLLLCCLAVLAAPQDSVFARMNAVKLDTGCIYGICTIEGRETSKDEAVKDLAERVEQWLSEHHTTFVKGLSSCPEGIVRFLSCDKGGNVWRTMAYVAKKDLEALEAEQMRQFESSGSGLLTALEAILSNASSIPEIEGRLKSLDSPFIRLGDLLFDTPQCDVDNSYLVFCQRNTGEVVEIMTPKDPSGARRNIRTGEKSDTMKYRHLPIKWIMLEGRNSIGL